MKIFERRDALVAAIATMTLAGCGSDGASDGGQASKHSVGIAVSGLAGSGLTLADNGGDLLQIAADGHFSFATSIASGSAYAVTIQAQPTPPPGALPQTCRVNSGAGTMGGADVLIAVTCTNNAPRFVYVVNYGSNNISGFAIDDVTGSLTAMDGSPFPSGDAPRVFYMC